MVGKVGAAGFDDVGCESYWISLLLYGRWNREAAHGARKSRLRRVWLRKRAQIGRTHVPQPRGRSDGTHHKQREQNDNNRPHWTIACTGGRSVTARHSRNQIMPRWYGGPALART